MKIRFYPFFFQSFLNKKYQTYLKYFFKCKIFSINSTMTEKIYWNNNQCNKFSLFQCYLKKTIKSYDDRIDKSTTKQKLGCQFFKQQNQHTDKYFLYQKEYKTILMVQHIFFKFSMSTQKNSNFSFFNFDSFLNFNINKKNINDSFQSIKSLSLNLHESTSTCKEKRTLQNYLTNIKETHYYSTFCARYQSSRNKKSHNKHIQRVSLIFKTQHKNSDVYKKQDKVFCNKNTSSFFVMKEQNYKQKFLNFWLLPFFGLVGLSHSMVYLNQVNPNLNFSLFKYSFPLKDQNLSEQTHYKIFLSPIVVNKIKLKSNRVNVSKDLDVSNLNSVKVENTFVFSHRSDFGSQDNDLLDSKKNQSGSLSLLMDLKTINEPSFLYSLYEKSCFILHKQSWIFQFLSNKLFIPEEFQPLPTVLEIKVIKKQIEEQNKLNSNELLNENYFKNNNVNTISTNLKKKLKTSIKTYKPKLFPKKLILLSNLDNFDLSFYSDPVNVKSNEISSFSKIDLKKKKLLTKDFSIYSNDNQIKNRDFLTQQFFFYKNDMFWQIDNLRKKFLSYQIEKSKINRLKKSKININLVSTLQVFDQSDIHKSNNEFNLKEILEKCFISTFLKSYLLTNNSKSIGFKQSISNLDFFLLSKTICHHKKNKTSKVNNQVLLSLPFGSSFLSFGLQSKPTKERSKIASFKNKRVFLTSLNFVQTLIILNEKTSQQKYKLLVKEPTALKKLSQSNKLFQEIKKSEVSRGNVVFPSNLNKVQRINSGRNEVSTLSFAQIDSPVRISPVPGFNIYNKKESPELSFYLTDGNLYSEDYRPKSLKGSDEYLVSRSMTIEQLPCFLKDHFWIPIWKMQKFFFIDSFLNISSVSNHDRNGYSEKFNWFKSLQDSLQNYFFLSNNFNSVDFFNDILNNQLIQNKNKNSFSSTILNKKMNKETPNLSHFKVTKKYLINRPTVDKITKPSFLIFSPQNLLTNRRLLEYFVFVKRQYRYFSWNQEIKKFESQFPFLTKKTSFRRQREQLKQSVRRLKLQQHKTRLQTKRKRSHPRPIWLRFNLYEKLLQKRYHLTSEHSNLSETSYQTIKNKLVINTKLLHFKYKKENSSHWAKASEKQKYYLNIPKNVLNFYINSKLARGKLTYLKKKKKDIILRNKLKNQENNFNQYKEVWCAQNTPRYILPIIFPSIHSLLGNADKNSENFIDKTVFSFFNNILFWYYFPTYSPFSLFLLSSSESNQTIFPVFWSFNKRNLTYNSLRKDKKKLSLLQETSFKHIDLTSIWLRSTQKHQIKFNKTKKIQRQLERNFSQYFYSSNSNLFFSYKKINENRTNKVLKPNLKYYEIAEEKYQNLLIFSDVFNQFFFGKKPVFFMELQTPFVMESSLRNIINNVSNLNSVQIRKNSFDKLEKKKFREILNLEQINNPSSYWWLVDSISTKIPLTLLPVKIHVNNLESIHLLIFLLIIGIGFQICCFFSLIAISQVRCTFKLFLLVFYKMSSLVSIQYFYNGFQTLFNLNRLTYSNLIIPKQTFKFIKRSSLNSIQKNTFYSFIFELKKKSLFIDYKFVGSAPESLTKTYIRNIINNRSELRSEDLSSKMPAFLKIVNEQRPDVLNLNSVQLNKKKQKNLLNLFFLIQIHCQYLSYTFYKLVYKKKKNLQFLFYLYPNMIANLISLIFNRTFEFFKNPDEIAKDFFALFFLVELSCDLSPLVPHSLPTNLFTFVSKNARFYRSFGIFSFFIKKIITDFFEIFLEQLNQPDTDLLTRQKKSILFYDIWLDFIFLLGSHQFDNFQNQNQTSQQIKMFYDFLFSTKSNTSRDSNSSRFLPTDQKVNIFMQNIIKNVSNLNLVVPLVDNYRVRDYDLQSKDPVTINKTSSRKNSMNTVSPWFFNSRLKSNLAWNQLNSFKELIEANFSEEILESFQWKIKNINLSQEKSLFHEIVLFEKLIKKLFPFYILFRTKLDIFHHSHKRNFGLTNFNRWAVNQYMNQQSMLQPELFISHGYPKLLTHTNLDSINFMNIGTKKKMDVFSIVTIGNLISKIYSGIFSKDIAKNILVVGKDSNDKTDLIQAIAGETELNVILENATRFTLIIREKAIGLTLLKEVFETLSSYSPCLFLLENIDVLGQRRPSFLFSQELDDDVFLNYNYALHEKNQIFYTLSHKKLSSYRRDFTSTTDNWTTFKKSNKNNQSEAFHPLSLKEKNSQRFLASFNNPLFFKDSKKQKINYINNDFPRKVKIFNNFISLGKNFDPFATLNSLKSFSAINALFLKNKNLKKMATQKNMDTIVSISRRVYQKQPFDKKSALQIFKPTFVTPPSNSPLTLFLLREKSILKSKKIVTEISWGGIGSEPLSRLPQFSYSIKSKVLLLVAKTLDNVQGKVNRITDLLLLLDTVRANRGFVFFATTHAPDLLDPALRRPGRFDETIYLPAKTSIKTNRWQKKSFPYNLPFSNIQLETFSKTDYFHKIKALAKFIDTSKLQTLRLVDYYHSLYKGISTKRTDFEQFIFEKDTISNNYVSNLSFPYLYSQVQRQNNQSCIKENSVQIPFIKEENQFFSLISQLKQFECLHPQIMNNIKLRNKKSIFNSNSMLLLNIPSVLLTRDLNLILKKDLDSGYLKKIKKFEKNMFNFAYYKILKTFYQLLNKNKNFLSNYKNLSEFRTHLILLEKNTYIEDRFCNLNKVQNSLLENKNLFSNDRSALRLQQNSVYSINKNKLRKFIDFQLNNTMIDFILSNKINLKEPLSAPFYKITLPSRRFENLKRLEQTYQMKHIFSIQEKIQIHESRKTVHRLYKTGRIDALNSDKLFDLKFDKLKLNRLLLRKIEATTKSDPNIMNWFLQNKIINRHCFLLTHQWWTGQLPEHNIETTFLSDIDWRMTVQTKFKKQLFGLYPLDRSFNSSDFKPKAAKSDHSKMDKKNLFNKNENLISMLNFVIDFPNSEQYYNPKQRRWMLKNGYYAYWSDLHICLKNIRKKVSNVNSFKLDDQRGIEDLTAMSQDALVLQGLKNKRSLSFEQSSDETENLLKQYYLNNYSYFQKNRELLDLLAFKYLKTGFIKESDFLQYFDSFLNH